MIRLATTCGGFVDVPSKVFDNTHPSSANVSFSKFTTESEKDDCLLMTCDLLERRAEYLVYSCGGLLIKTYDLRGENCDEIVVRFVDHSA